MNQFVELRTAPRLLAEDDVAESGSIDGSIGRQNSRPELLHHGCIHCLTRLEQMMCDLIRIEDGATQLAEHGPNGTFARCDSAGQADPKHHSPRRMRAALIVFFINVAIVIGPTPPGTGVIIDATSLTARSSTSPAQT